MNRSVKLVLDIVIGAVIPILVLSYLTEPLGAVPAYLISALIPVAWVAIDLLFITRRFNVITSLLGLNAVVRGLLAFWFVDGALFALKDSAGAFLWTAIVGGSLLAGRPILRAFAVQSLDPRTPEQEGALARLLAERSIARRLAFGTALLALVYAATTAANFLLNLWIVTARFGSAAFNDQVARVNAITRFALGIPEFLVMAGALWLVFAAVYAALPDVPGTADIWEMLRRRDEAGSGERQAASLSAAAPRGEP